MAISSNYPKVVDTLTLLVNTMDQQSAKFPNRPLFFNVKEFPGVLNNTIGQGRLDQTAFAIMLNDVYFSYVEEPTRWGTHPIIVEPNPMSDESIKLVEYELNRRNVSIPTSGTMELKRFFFMLYGRDSSAIVTKIYHPESIVAHILWDEPLVPIWERAKPDMITQSLNNYPVATKVNVNAFRAKMAQYSSNMDVNDVLIGTEKYRVNLNNIRVDDLNGGLWDRNSRTFGTWSSFPKDGDYLYGINIAGAILGVLDNTLAGVERQHFKNNQWENRIRYLCLSASMNNFTFSYIFDHIGA